MKRQDRPYLKTIAEEFGTPAPEWYLQEKASTVISKSTTTKRLEAQVLEQDLTRFRSSYVSACLVITTKPRSRRLQEDASKAIDAGTVDRLWGWLIGQEDFRQAWAVISESPDRPVLNATPARITAGNRSPTELAFLSCVAQGMLQSIAQFRYQAIDPQNAALLAEKARRFIGAIRQVERASGRRFDFIAEGARSQIEAISHLSGHLGTRRSSRPKSAERIVVEAVAIEMMQLFTFAGEGSGRPQPRVLKGLIKLCGLKPPSDDADMRAWLRELTR